MELALDSRIPTSNRLPARKTVRLKHVTISLLFE